MSNVYPPPDPATLTEGNVVSINEPPGQPFVPPQKKKPAAKKPAKKKPKRKAAKAVSKRIKKAAKRKKARLRR
jgi:hypothetical protein